MCATHLTGSRATKPTRGYFDVGIEATGAAGARHRCSTWSAAGGGIVQVGMLPPGDVPVPANKLMAREIDYRRCVPIPPANTAVRCDCWCSQRVDVAPILTHDLPLARRQEAFAARRRPDAVDQGPPVHF